MNGASLHGGLVAIVMVAACGPQELVHPAAAPVAPSSSASSAAGAARAAPASRCGRARFDSFDAALRSDVLYLAAEDPARPLVPEKTGQAQARIAKDGARAADAMAARIDELDAVGVGSSTPAGVLLAARGAPEALPVARCILARTAAELAGVRARGDAGLTGRLEDRWTNLRAVVDFLELGHDRRCDVAECPDDELCIATCAVGPATPALPTCHPVPPGAPPERACAPAGCPRCVVLGRRARCECAPTPM